MNSIATTSSTRTTALAEQVIANLGLLLVGIYMGGVVCFVLAPSVTHLDAHAYISFWQAENHDYGRVMPILLLTCLATVVASAAMGARHGRRVWIFELGAATLIGAAILVTVTRMEPLNHQANSWDPDNPPADWETIRSHWLAWHDLRTAFAVAAFTSLLIARTALDTPRRIR
ncbi:anthrone oxygenase family protein [Nocardia sp. NPDC088792]|uniref:anthrone oxygenase family protein n=1 Tax=Nocardia sp. NPDC088792 TaxID=3364332 RepID=UPI00382CC982